LMRQARAFQKRGDLELARNAAEQERKFARNPPLHREVEGLLAVLGPGSGRVLKDRWAGSGWSPVVQALPMALAVGMIAGAVTFFMPSTAPVRHDTVRHAAIVKEAPPLHSVQSVE